ncbi:MAG: hypothetical protein LBP76_15205 [Treponema sp.]|jgi:hypothetical protein|nr:hypothetical protein [Treponema sp.]
MKKRILTMLLLSLIVSAFGQTKLVDNDKILFFQWGMSENAALTAMRSSTTGEITSITSGKMYQGALSDNLPYYCNLNYHNNQLYSLFIFVFVPLDETNFNDVKNWCESIQNLISQSYGPMKKGDDAFPQTFQALMEEPQPVYDYGNWENNTMEVSAGLVLRKDASGHWGLMPVFNFYHKQLFHQYMMATDPDYRAINAPPPATPTTTRPGMSPTAPGSTTEPTLRSGTYRRSDIRGHELVLISSPFKQVTYRMDGDPVAQGTYEINGTVLIIEYTMFFGDSGLRNQLQGKKLVYTITSDRTFSGNNQSWVQ